MDGCWIYLRISEDESGDRAAVTRHGKECQALADRLGLPVSGVVEDNDTSATTGVRRPGFDRVLALPAGTVVVCWHLDRLVRKLADLEKVIDAGLTVHGVQAGAIDLSTPTGKAVARTITTWSQFEGEHRAARQRSALDQLVADGRWAGGRRCLGYELGMTGFRETEAVAVRDAFRWLLEGAGPAEIARRWNAAGLRTTQSGESWRSGWVAAVLRNPTYAGLRTHRGEIKGAAVWEPMVDRAMWEATQAILGDPGRRQNKARMGSSLLASIAMCGRCDSVMHAGGNAQRGGLYVCATQRHVAVRRPPVDEYVSGVIVARLRRPDMARAFEVEAPDIGPLVAEHEALSARRESLADNLYDMDEFTLARRTRAILARLGELSAAISEASRASVTASLPRPAEVAARWDELPVDRRRQVIRLIAEVRLDPPGRGSRGFRPETVRVTPRVIA